MLDVDEEIFEDKSGKRTTLSISSFVFLKPVAPFKNKFVQGIKNKFLNQIAFI
jgi:hypothetical protein